MKKNKWLIGVVIGLSCVLPPVVFADEGIAIHLQIETASSTLFNSDVTVSACSAEASSTPTFSGYCAIKQSGLESEWSTFGDDKFLSSVSGIGNDYTTNTYWGWFANLEYGQTSLLKHELIPNEYLLVTLGKMPLKITVATTTPYLESTTTVSVFHFGFDDAWNALWQPATTSSLKIDETIVPVNEQGSYEITISTTTPFSIRAQENGYIDSASILISPIIKSETSTTTETGSGGGGGGGTVSHPEFSVERAVQFLLSKQKPDGSFGSDLYTDWVAIALASSGVHNEQIRTQVKNSTSATSITDYERHAMALLALGINPYSETTTNYIQKIVDSFDGNQIADSSLVNDDIFALFPLLKTGFSANDDMIQKIVSFIISKQQSNGSWENSVDVTASAIQALSSLQTLNEVSTTLVNAKNYLASHQVLGGGFGSSFSTSWSLQALSALGESSGGWIKDGATPDNALADAQQIDGGVESATADEATRIWATAYAIPAGLHRPWPTILSSFSKPNIPVVPPTPVTVPAPIVATTTPEVKVPEPLPEIKKVVVTPEISKPEVKNEEEVKEVVKPETQLASVEVVHDSVSYSTYVIVGLCLLLAFAGLSYKIKK